MLRLTSIDDLSIQVEKKKYETYDVVYSVIISSPPYTHLRVSRDEYISANLF